MKHLLLASVAALGLVTAAAAQTSTTTTGSITITPEVRTKARQYIVQEKRPSVAVPSGFNVAVGATLPASVEIYSFPADVGVTEYRYTMIGNQAVLVDPSSRRIVQIISE